MGTVTIVEKNYRRFYPVAQGELCLTCPVGCKTSCQRLDQTRVPEYIGKIRTRKEPVRLR